ncbi:MAG: hypothetical protein IPK79_08035 [Vampirovibrionales bacterium]|nr:hypothetical protein [Vampirovibrionales bacterium]
MLGSWIRVLTPPILALLLYCAPIRLQQRQLLGLAFWLWLAGGVSLMINGVIRLSQGAPTVPAWVAALAIALAVVIGAAKGLFVLSKTSQRNIARIQGLEGPQRASAVYALPSWILIEAMMLFSAALTWLHVPDLWRGAVNLAVGLALVASSLRYWRRVGAAHGS